MMNAHFPSLNNDRNSTNNKTLDKANYDISKKIEVSLNAVNKIQHLLGKWSVQFISKFNL